MILYSVYDADGGHFRMVDEEQALALLELQAAIIDGKPRHKIKLRLTVEPSTARAILAPRFPVSQASRTTIIEYVGDQQSPLYQHHERRCANWLRIQE